MSEMIHRTLHPEVRTEGKGIAVYIASDESVDNDREVVRASGWRFDEFRKNAPFLNSHRKGSIEDQLGKVIDYKVSCGRLMNTVQWAIDVPENKLAQLGWKMTEAGYLKAVSVGFVPVRQVTKHDSNKAEWQKQVGELKLREESGVWRVFTEQQQMELSSCVIGANANALHVETAKAYKAGVISDEDLNLISLEQTKSETADVTMSPDEVAFARRRAREVFWGKMDRLLKRI